MAEHRKVEMTTVAWECSEGDCEHYGNLPCPSEVMEVCEECTALNWRYHEGPVVPWDECWLNGADEAPDACDCGCHDTTTRTNRSEETL